MRLTFLYTLFAALATLVNIGMQDLCLRLNFGSHTMTLSVLAGTGTGLVAKYILDKRYIFRFTTKGVAQDGMLFVLYTFMGIITTGIFWAFEFGFEALFHDKWLRYLGGCIGLTIGYITKYHLDKRLVFRKPFHFT